MASESIDHEAEGLGSRNKTELSSRVATLASITT